MRPDIEECITFMLNHQVSEIRLLFFLISPVTFNKSINSVFDVQQIGDAANLFDQEAVSR